MPVRLISEREAEPAPMEELIPDPERVAAPSGPVKPMRAEVQFPAPELMAVLAFLTKALASRVLLLLAGIGAFVLAYAALKTGTWAAGISAGVFDLTVFLPCLWLARGS